MALPGIVGIQMFWECDHCERRIAIDNGDDGQWVFGQGGEDTWWSWPPEHEGWPETCPRCENEDTYVEQATLVLVEVFYEWGYKQWSRSGADGWRLKFKIGMEGLEVRS